MAPSEECKLEATVVTGLEFVAKEECSEKLNVEAVVERGRIFFDLPTNEVQKALTLRGVDNVYVVIQNIKIEFTGDKASDLKLLEPLSHSVDWHTGLMTWQKVTEYNKVSLEDLMCPKIQNTPEDDTSVTTDNFEDASDTLPVARFRVTCYRTGNNHSFSSMEAAATFGGAIDDKFCWKVDLKNFDIHVVLNIDEDNIYVCIALTKESLHHRNLEHFGLTALRSTIAYNLLRLCSIKPGETVCDPMCGGGSIPIEAALSWPKAYHLCGDNHPTAAAICQKNIEALNKKLLAQNKGDIKIAMFRWDACQLPLKSNSVDVFITDLPFGKRIGSKAVNRVLYPRLLDELARVCRQGTGRGILLTHDRKNLSRAIGIYSKYWHQVRVIGTNIGGLISCVYLLHRSAVQFLEASTNGEAEKK